MGIDVEAFGYTSVTPDDTFQFRCSRCGDCCRNVKGSIMLESLDLFRLVRFLQKSVEDVILQYTNLLFLSWGYPIFLLKTRAPRDACVFLRELKCSVYDARPRACQTYPLGTGPDDEKVGTYQNFIVSRKQHHFTGPSIYVKDWMDKNFPEEHRKFVLADCQMAGELAKLLRSIDKRHEDSVLKLMLFYRYLDFDIKKDFQEQFVRNMACLKLELARLASQD